MSAPPLLAATLPPALAAGPAGDERARLHEAATGFEAIFVRQMLEAARASQFGTDLLGDDPGRETFAAMRDERLADLTAQSGALGLAKRIEAELGDRVAPAAQVQP